MKQRNIHTIQQAKKFLSGYIPVSRDEKFQADHGLIRMKALLTLLNNPQEQYKSIHIAGTSGKGSTTYLISTLLHIHGFKIGLTQSPHILDIRERVQINGICIAEEKFCYYLESIIPSLIAVESTYGQPGYFEVITALAFYAFAQEHVDYAVIETGIGGMYDPTNTIQREDKLSVITRLGKDHLTLLGSTIEAIACQKAGIINKKATAIVLYPSLPARKSIEARISHNDATLIYIRRNEMCKNITISKTGTTFDFTFTYKEISIRLPQIYISLVGSFQVENTCLALSTLIYMSNTDSFSLRTDAIYTTLRHVYIPGRMDIRIAKKQSKTYIIDGAHNPQKMKALCKTLTTLWPETKFLFFISFQKGKSYIGMLKYIMPIANEIVFSSFDTHNASNIEITNHKKRIETYMRQYNESKDKNENSVSKYTFFPKSNDAIVYIKEIQNSYVVVTSSLFFVSQFYSYISILDAAAINSRNNG